jgi:hypothetical protein
MTTQIRRAFLLVLFAVVAFACKPAKKNPNVLEGGEIKYSVSGNDRGIVRYAAGVRPHDATEVGDWLRNKGWFVTREELRSAISGRARGSFGTGAVGRGSGQPLAKVALRGNGLEVIVYASAQDAESTDVIAFGAESADELKKRVAKPVRFVIRSETKKGEGLEWVDSYWDSEDDQVARSKGK